MLNTLQKACLVLIGVVLLVVLPVASAEISRTAPDQSPASYTLPASAWWLVIHDQCADTLHWINPSGKYASIPRPVMPNEAPGGSCSYRAMHISPNGRYLAQIAALNTGRVAVGFYDLQTAAWLKIIEALPDELVQFGARYSSDTTNRIAVSFFNKQEVATRAWRVILFDMMTGNQLDELRSDGPEIAAFVGGEFLATAAAKPYVVLLAKDIAVPGSDQIHIRFDAFDLGAAPIGAAAWFPAGVPGVGQAMVSSSYSRSDQDVLPDGHAVFAYNEPSFPAGPPVPDTTIPITTNTIGTLIPTALGGAATPQAFYADGLSTVYHSQWAADGRIALFRRTDAASTGVYWVKMGAAVLIPLGQDAAQIIGVPTGFVFNTAGGIYFLDEATSAISGPIFSDPMLSGSAAFVWASGFGNPPLTLDSLVTLAPPIMVTATPGITLAPPIVVTATLDSGTCRAASADGSNINVRSGPGTNYPTLGQMSGASELDVVGVNGQWYVVNYSGVQGWIASWVMTLKGSCTALTFVTAPPPPPPTAVPPGPTAPPAPAGVIIEFGADRTNINAGECVNVSWRVENIREVYFEGEGVIGTGSRSVCPASTTTYTLTIVLTDGSSTTRTVTITVGGGGGGGQPDLFVSEFSLNPATPTKGQPVQVRVGVYNGGTASVSGTNFHIEWYPGENYPSPACTWDLDSMAANGGRILECTYAGYPSPYGSIHTLVVVDSGNSVAESNEGNNTYRHLLSVNP